MLSWWELYRAGNSSETSDSMLIKLSCIQTFSIVTRTDIPFKQMITVPQFYWNLFMWAAPLMRLMTKLLYLCYSASILLNESIYLMNRTNFIFQWYQFHIELFDSSCIDVFWFKWTRFQSTSHEAALLLRQLFARIILKINLFSQDHCTKLYACRRYLSWL